MAISFHCECGKEFLTKDEESGRCVTCPRCQRELILPRPTLIPQDDFASFHEFGPSHMSGKGIAIWATNGFEQSKPDTPRIVQSRRDCRVGLPDGRRDQGMGQEGLGSSG